MCEKMGKVDDAREARDAERLRGDQRKPGLVVAGGGRPVRDAAGRLHLHGWDVVNVPATDAVRAAIGRKPLVVLLPEDAGLESGYLVAAKLKIARPRTKVILIGPCPCVKAERFANFVGARYAAETDDLVERLAESVV
jgi:hypothetical protein